MGKRLLITGAGGFIGSHLTEKCVEQGYQVRAFIHYNSRNQYGWLERSNVLGKIEVVSGDIRDFDSVMKAAQGCEQIFHLAALIGIPYSYVSPLAYIKTNIEGTYNVLESARILGTKNVVVTSTSETYGSAQYVPIDEKHPLVGQSPYSATKIGADELALSFARSFGLPVRVARPFNTFGPRQSARAVIPSIIIQILNKQRQIRLGNIDTKRDLTFVLDTVQGFLEIAESPKLVGQVTNVGMNEEISIEELAHKIAELMNVRIRIVQDKPRVRPNQSEVKRLLCDNSKILKHTAWKPKHNLESGLKLTIAWLRKNAGLYKAGLYNV
jgi:NAD dependent epimerase/dehydratase